MLWSRGSPSRTFSPAARRQRAVHIIYIRVYIHNVMHWLKARKREHNIILCVYTCIGSRKYMYMYMYVAMVTVVGGVNTYLYLDQAPGMLGKRY